MILGEMFSPSVGERRTSIDKYRYTNREKHNDYWGLFCKLIPHSLMSNIVHRFPGGGGVHQV